MPTEAAAPSFVRPGHLNGMARLDTSGNTRIPVLMELVGALSRCNEPEEVLRTFARGAASLYGPRGYISLSTRGLAPGEYRITRLLPDMTPEGLSSIDSWSDTARIPVQRGGLLSEIIRTAYPEIINHLDVTDDPVLGDALAGFGSLMAIPLFDDGEPLNWAITMRRDPEGFTVEELEEWVLRSNLVGGTVRNTLMARQLREANELIRREMDEIAKIQRALLPAELPRIPGLSMAAHYETFDVAGGDMYDFTPVGDPDRSEPESRPWAMVIADASGHGPAAATLVAMLNALLYAAPHDLDSPAEVLAFANHHLHSKGIEGRFVTAILAGYEPASRRFTYARAGHNPALLMHACDGPIEISRLDEVGGVPLGVMADVQYEDHSVELAPGHTIVLYTDGITEAADPQGRQFGVAGIERSLTECTGHPECVINHITAALRDHQGGAHPADDQTIVAIRVDDAT